MANGYKDIYKRFKRGILSGDLRPSEKVPSIRTLALELGVAKKTVEAAYDILIGEGYLVGRGAKGTIVNPDLVINKVQIKNKPLQNEDKELETFINLRDSEGHFRLGVPSLDMFPSKIWLNISGKILRSMSENDMISCPVAGHEPLRNAIANYVNISRGLHCSSDQVFITSGYKNSVALILKALAQKNDKIVFEDPGYFFGHRLLKRISNNFHYSSVDSQGLNIYAFKKNHSDAKFVFITPSHQSPLTHTLSLPRRNELLEWAKNNKSWIVEDDYDGEFHYTKKVIPSLKSLDLSDRVIYVGTFSKTIMPAARTSYVIVPKSLVRFFDEICEITETGLPLLPQKIITQFINDGHFYRHLKKMRILYQKRREMVLNALQKVFPDTFSFEVTNGGMHIVAYLKKGTNDKEMADFWNKNGLQVVPLSLWYASKRRKYGLVIGFTNIKSQKEAEFLLSRVK